MMLSIIVVQTQRGGADNAPQAPAMESLDKLAEKAKQALTPPPPTAYEIESAMSHADLIKRWNPIIKAASQRFGVPEKWIRAVMRQESGGRTMLAEGVKIVSPVGAMGLMQVMPQTYAELRKTHNLGKDAFDPQDNIYAGAAYLSWLKRRYGFNGMFAAYNAGPGTYENARAGKVVLPNETRNYVRSIARMLGVDAPEFAVASALENGVNAIHGKRAKSERLVSADAMQKYRRILLTIPMPAASTQTSGRMYEITGQGTPAPQVQSVVQPVMQSVVHPVTQLANNAGKMWRVE